MTATSGADRCRCRNLADEDMPPSERIGDTEAKRRGLWSTADCTLHRPASGADQPTLRDPLAELRVMHASLPHDPRAGDPAFCGEDGKPWPCPTYQGLQLIEADRERPKAEAAAEALEKCYREDHTTVAKMTPIQRLTCVVVKTEDMVMRVAALRGSTGGGTA